MVVLGFFCKEFLIFLFLEWYWSSSWGIWCLSVALSVLLRILAQICRLWEEKGQQREVWRGKVEIICDRDILECTLRWRLS